MAGFDFVANTLEISASARTKAEASGVGFCTWGSDPARFHDLRRARANGDLVMLGLHPWFVEPDNTEVLQTIASEAQPAIGEVGLDFLIERRPAFQAHQERAFRDQLAIARRQRRGLLIHAVRSVARILSILDHDGFPPFFVLHGFSGSRELAAQVLKRGGYLSFGSSLLKSPKTQQSLVDTPLERLLFETDAPHRPICHDPGPADVAVLAQFAAGLKGVSAESLLCATTLTASQLLGYNSGPSAKN